MPFSSHRCGQAPNLPTPKTSPEQAPRTKNLTAVSHNLRHVETVQPLLTTYIIVVASEKTYTSIHPATVLLTRLMRS